MPEPRSFKYKAFISYSHDDRGWGLWLHRALEGYRVPQQLVGAPSPLGPTPKRLRPVFRDREDLSAGADLSEKINDALENSAFLIVVCSPNAANSDYVNEEIKRFRAMGRSDRILALMVDGEPGDPDLECFPPALRFSVNARNELVHEEPVAADAREEGDGKHLAKLKIISGLLDVPLDHVIMRTEVDWRRRKIKMGLAATGVAVLTLFAGFYYFQYATQRVEIAYLVELQKQQSDPQVIRRKALQIAREIVRQMQLNAAGDAPRTKEEVRFAEESVADLAESAIESGNEKTLAALKLLKAGKIVQAEKLLQQVLSGKTNSVKLASREPRRGVRMRGIKPSAPVSQSDREAAEAARNLAAVKQFTNPAAAAKLYRKAKLLDPTDPRNRPNPNAKTSGNS